MTDWADLGRELDIWHDRATLAKFWWRDDDAIDATKPLARMLDLANSYEAPLALAVIPSLAKPALAEVLDCCSHVAVLQHGFAHTNHGVVGQKKIELGNHRAPDEVLSELAVGLKVIKSFAGGLPVLVPPWNRIDPSLLPALPVMGYRALSTFKPRRSVCIIPGLMSINTHIDIIDWHQGQGFIGTSAVLDQVVGHLVARRKEAVEPFEPTGLLTHHLVHDENCWLFMEKFLAYLNNHEGAVLINISEAIA